MTRTRPWTDEEDAIIRNARSKERHRSIEDIQRLLKVAGYRRTCDAVRLRIAELGLEAVTAARLWTSDEDALVRECIRQGMSPKATANHLRQKGWRRSEGGVQYRMSMLRNVDAADVEVDDATPDADTIELLPPFSAASQHAKLVARCINHVFPGLR